MPDTATTPTAPDVAPTSAHLTRRAVLAGACVACAATVTACATYGPATSAPAQAPAQAEAPAQASGAPAAGGGGASSGAKALTTVAKVPVGGGVIVGDTVITQPKKGEFKAFGVICPHAGCTVNEIADGTINCPCHGSKFSVTDGSVKDGPAPKGLDTKKVAVSGDNITLA
jgi:Rieske Fe-S protein